MFISRLDSKSLDFKSLILGSLNWMNAVECYVPTDILSDFNAKMG